MASLPQFFHKGILKEGDEIWLDEDTVRHVVQVLRMQPGEKIQMANGEGYSGIAAINKIEKKKCAVVLDAVSFHKQRSASLHLCVAFTKNTSRNEWLLEKATELGVAAIIPVIAERTEREKFRYDRWNNLLVSALLQSQQYYLPRLHEPMQLKQIFESFVGLPQKLMGHCIEGLERLALSEMLKPGLETIVLIGPEGDFSKEEVNLCIQKGFKSVSMGSQRLRTETAAMAVCAYFNLINNENI